MKNTLKTIGLLMAIVTVTVIIGLIVTSFTSCTTQNSTTVVDTTETEIKEESTKVSREKALEIMVEMYQKDLWDGQPMQSPSIPEHEYAIRNGILLEDGAEIGIYPDIVIGDVSFKEGKFLGKAPSADGILITDSNYYTIGRFYKGELINAGDIFDETIHYCNERAKFYVKDRFVVMLFGQHLRVWDYLNNWKVEGRDDALDIVEDENEIRISTLSHDNYKLDISDGKLVKVKTSYAKFPTHTDLTMIGIPMSIQQNLRPYGIVLYAGTGIDQLYYYMYDNGDGKTYTLCMRDDDEGEVKIVAKNVIDAETSIGVCFYITTDGTVYKHTIRNGVEEVYNGTAYGLTPTWTEDDRVCIVTSEKEATVQDTSNGWDYLTY